MEKYSWFVVFVSLNSLLLLGLAGYVSSLRMRYKIAYGDGDNKQLFRAIRAHANAVEQFPIFALVILALMVINYSPLQINIIMATFTAARIAHALGIILKIHVARRLGAAMTYLLQAAVAIIALTEVFT
ncbi:MAG: MAPEG family protein [Kangiellaceae bacterium]|nr:MAPEG family protein [Kangiellaceae bacterium]MCW9000823.1 MAPEG family protein [Kangiellaceae bacterium]